MSVAPRIDLRNYQIKTQEDVIAFLDLFTAKMPQMVTVMKKLNLENQSLRNHNSTLNERNKELAATPDMPELVDGNISVTDRLAGKTYAPGNVVTEQQRLAQLAAATDGDASDIDEVITDPKLQPKLPVAAGQIGTLGAPDLPPIDPTVGPVANEIDNDGANGEPSTDDIELDLVPNDPPVEPEVQLVDPASTVGVGDRIANATNGQPVAKPLKKYNRPELNALATELSVADPESYESNRTLREAIEAVQAVNATAN